MARQLLNAGLAGELHLGVMPVLLGAGLSFFCGADLGHVELETIGVREIGIRTNLRFRGRTS